MEKERVKGNLLRGNLLQRLIILYDVNPFLSVFLFP